MKRLKKVGLVAFFALMSAQAFGVSPVPRATLSPSPSPVASALPTPTPSLTPTEMKTLLKEFQKAQKTELKALEHRHKFELKELKSSQDVRWREWKKKEAQARHKFFDEQSKGPERRAYIAEFLEKQESLRKLLIEEKKKRIQEQAVDLAALRQEQHVRYEEFKKLVQGGQRPPIHLWPQSGQ
jgi:hypothetical protein